MIFIFQSIKVVLSLCTDYICKLTLYILRSCTFTGEDSRLYSFVSEAIKIYFKNKRYSFYLNHPHI